MVFQKQNEVTTAQGHANDDTNITLLSIASSLSFLGCMVIFVTYALFRDIRTSSRRIIVFITLADLVTVCFNWSGILMSAKTSSPLYCILQSFGSTTALLCSFLWTIALSIFLYVTLAKENQELAEKLVSPWFHLICWPLPLLINGIGAAKGHLGNNVDVATAGWCWIKIDDRKTSIFWMLLDGKLIEILAFILILVLYIKIKIHLRKKITKFENFQDSVSSLTRRTFDASKQADKKLIFIPLIFIVLRVWGTIRFFIYISNNSNENYTYTKFDFILIRFQAVGDNLQGFTNCILFCFFTPKVRRHMKDMLSLYLWSGCRIKFNKKVNDEVNERSNLLDCPQ